MLKNAVSRRTMLVASATGLSALPYVGQSFAGTAGSNAYRDVRAGAAKSTILFFLCGGASHLDTWDMKPNAPLEYRGSFSPIATSAPGVILSEHLPMMSQQAHHLTIVNSIGGSVNTNDHHGFDSREDFLNLQ